MFYRFRQGLASMMVLCAILVPVLDDVTIWDFAGGLAPAGFYLVLGMVFLFLRRTKLMLVSLACSAFLSFWYGELAHPPRPIPYKIAHFDNKGGIDSNFIRQILQQKAEFITIRPLAPAEDSLLKVHLVGHFPYYVSQPQAGSNGWAWYAMRPFNGCDTLPASTVGLYNLNK